MRVDGERFRQSRVNNMELEEYRLKRLKYKKKPTMPCVSNSIMLLGDYWDCLDIVARRMFAVTRSYWKASSIPDGQSARHSHCTNILSESFFY